MERSPSELDLRRFLRCGDSKPPPSPERVGSSSRGIQNVVSRINPQMLKSVMAAGESGGQGNSLCGGESRRREDFFMASNTWFSAAEVAAGKLPWPLPVLDPKSRSVSLDLSDTPPLTIFYNGTVIAVNMPRIKAEAIINTVESLMHNKSDDDRLETTLADSSHPDLPIMRRKSLQRFLEKRKERLLSASPYHTPTVTTDSC